jgi:hypothetical protein
MLLVVLDIYIVQQSRTPEFDLVGFPIAMDQGTLAPCSRSVPREGAQLLGRWSPGFAHAGCGFDR